MVTQKVSFNFQASPDLLDPRASLENQERLDLMAVKDLLDPADLLDPLDLVEYLDNLDLMETEVHLDHVENQVSRYAMIFNHVMTIIVKRGSTLANWSMGI